MDNTYIWKNITKKSQGAAWYKFFAGDVKIVLL